MSSLAHPSPAAAAAAPIDDAIRATREQTGARYAALYVRVSTGRQKDNWSVKDQLGLARLGEARGLRVVVYNEGAESSETIEGRPVMMCLLRDVEAGRVAAIICVATSRLSRDEDVIDTLTIQAACRANKTLVITPEQVYDYATRAGTVFGQIKAVFDADQKQEIIKATTRGKYALFRETGYAGGPVELGFVLVYDVPHKDGRLRARRAIDPQWREVIRRIYRLYTDPDHPRSDYTIARLLNDEGSRVPVRITAPPRRDGTRFQAGELREWQTQDIRRILRARAYLVPSQTG
jgi:DNA invertase Pin-like site-specific DNA recombinase